MQKIFEILNTLDKNGKPRKMRKEIETPTNKEKWFYFVENKNIPLLEDMVLKGCDINQMDITGQTIAHYSLLSKSHKLFNFCLKYKADFNVVDLFDVNPSKIIFQKNYSFYFFKKIIELYDFKLLIVDKDYQESICFLANYDSNLSKIKFLFSKFPKSMEPLRDKLINKSLERNTVEIWKYLSGRGVLIYSLQKNLKIKDTSSILIKI